MEKQDIYVVYIYTALGKFDSWAKAANTAERRSVWHRLNTVPCSHFGAKKVTKTAAVEQGFFARGGKLLGILVSLLLIEKFSLITWKKEFKLQEIRTPYLTTQTLTWLSCFSLVLMAGLPWHTPTSSHLQGCSMGKTNDKNIQALTVKKTAL